MSTHPFTALEPTVNEQGEDDTREVETSYDTISDLIEELQENAIELPAMQYDDDLAVYDAYSRISDNGTPSTMAELEAFIDDADERYRGHFHTDADFAAAELDDFIDSNEWWAAYFDYDKMGRDLMIDNSEHNGYYFRMV